VPGGQCRIGFARLPDFDSESLIAELFLGVFERETDDQRKALLMFDQRSGVRQQRYQPARHAGGG
jgi:hypothetical protein